MNTNLFEKTSIIEKLNSIIISTNKKLEGNCLYKHLKIGQIRVLAEKLRQNLYKLAKISDSILEVGFNGGHSSALYLYANPNIKILSFDSCGHKYTEPCAKYLMENNNLEFIKGNSNITIPKYKVTNIYDIIHIDGGHGVECATLDLLNCKKFADKNTLIVFDDANFPELRNLLKKYVNNHFIKEINYRDKKLHKIKYHRIFYYWKNTCIPACEWGIK